MAELKESSRVRIKRREATDDDMKSQLFFNYYGGLVGTILKVYSPAEVSVDIDHESLTTEVRRRHDDVRRNMKDKWLDGLSEEGKARLTEREKNFRLRYVILTSMDDLEPGPPRAAEAAALEKDDSEEEETLERVSASDLAANEEEYLRARAENLELE